MRNIEKQNIKYLQPSSEMHVLQENTNKDGLSTRVRKLNIDPFFQLPGPKLDALDMPLASQTATKTALPCLPRCST